jgi:hypothetical protein
VLAGLAGAAGIAGTAQAVNLNPDGLGQVLIYPYYTSNHGNDTLLSVVNTSSDAKAVKVRFKEGYNSREVLDFNMYMSAYDVWVAAISDIDGTPNLIIPDSTCTVPYLYEDAYDADYAAGVQPFLPYDYSGDNEDGGPTDISRASEGHFEIIEMGTLTDDSATAKRLGSAEAASHVIDSDGVQAPQDCDQLVDNWTMNPDGMWIDDPTIDIHRNSGGLFGGAAIINVGNGTMFSYDAKAIQGFDDGSDGTLHARPGGPDPSLNSGADRNAYIFFGEPRNDVVRLHYPRGVDALSAVFMHEHSMNEFNIEAGLHAASEWVITFPTKNFYVDDYTVGNSSYNAVWEPDPLDQGCNGWDPGEDYPAASTNPPSNGTPIQVDDNGIVQDTIDAPPTNGPIWTDWVACTFVYIDPPDVPIPPFTQAWNGDACEPFDITVWDREENSSEGPNNPGKPIVSPPPPGGSTPDVPNDICYEVNVLRFGNDGQFNPVFGTDSDLLKTVDTGSVPYDSGNGSKARVNGWAMINWYNSSDNVLCESGDCWTEGNQQYDWVGLLGLPVTGFWAEQFENGFLGSPGDHILANYGGLFQHKGNVRRSGVNNRRRRGND